MSKHRLFALFLGLGCFDLFANEFSGRAEIGLTYADTLKSWQDGGTGILRFDDTSAQLFQGFVSHTSRPLAGLTTHVVANVYADGEQHIGLTQAFAEYKPLSPNKIRYKLRTGFFYPRYSVENTSEGWLSPYTYTQSAINSWVGEEIKIPGVEVALFSNGRRFRSPWSWEVNAALFKGNDPAGTLLAWRGWSYHDRQSLHHDRINFAPIPTIVNDVVTPTWIDPFDEIDGRWGGYIGLHLNHQHKTVMKYYYYDNNADPSAITDIRLYAWATKFHSLAIKHKLSPTLDLLAQAMAGSTDMGPSAVYAHFYSAYLMLSHQQDEHRFAIRIEASTVEENNDLMPNDQNDSETSAITAAWRYSGLPNGEFGIELHANRNSADNRQQLFIEPDQSDQQIRIVYAMTF
ncbi:MAG: hypothetical protein AAGJ37_01235 [Pseudomonadota bacterium]